jgi:hypothetical protein
MANASREQYQELDVLIVPSPILNAEGDAFLDIDPATGMFTGGHLRLCAAAEFLTRWRPRSIAVVGGLHAQHGTRMTDTMEQFIKQRNRDAHVQKVNSLPCTRHNVIALFNQLGRQLEGKRVAVLTNEYHLRRFMEFWSRVQLEYGFRVVEPLGVAAEWICPSAETDFTWAALELRRNAEARGVADLRAGNYVDRCLDQLSSFRDHLAKSPESYLSPAEQKRMVCAG